MAGLGDPTAAIERQRNRSEIATENWTKATVNIDGKPTPVEWAGRINPGKLEDLKVREQGGQVVRAIPSARGSQVEIMNSQGAYYSRENNHVFSSQHQEGDRVPTPADFTRGAALLNAVIASPEYKADIAGAGITNGNFSVVADAREVRAAPAAPAPRQ